MSAVIERFLSEERLMRDTDFAALMGWSDDTLRANLARRDAPNALRIRRLVLFRFDDVSAWLARVGNTVVPKGEDAAASDLLGARK